MSHPSQISKSLEGIQTEVLVQNFADRVLVIVTQIGKVGNLIQASMPKASPLPNAIAPNVSDESGWLPEPPPSIELTALFGSTPSDEVAILQSLYVSQIATIIWTRETQAANSNDRRNVVVGLAFQRRQSDGTSETGPGRETFLGVMSMVLEILQNA